MIVAVGPAAAAGQFVGGEEVGHIGVEHCCMEERVVGDIEEGPLEALEVPGRNGWILL